MFRFSLVIILPLLLVACTGPTVVRTTTTKVMLPGETHVVTKVTRVASAVELAYLQRGQRSFDRGYYKLAMRELLPLAADGNPDAQYAVGYMYYYGYGVTQDTDVGCFWITRAANQHLPAAMLARDMVLRRSKIDAEEEK